MAIGCASTPTDVTALVGRYELRSVDGQSLPEDRLGGAIDGDLRLTADGRATRVVRYARSGLPDPFVYRVAGTYQVRGRRITLQLAQEYNPPGSNWEVSGEVQARSIVLRFPNLANRTTEEVYVRVP